MNKKISVIKFFASAVLLAASVLAINSCDKDDSEAPLPTITNFSPATGVEGATVTITGANFSTTASANAVTFNGTAATVTAATATQITTTVPTGATTGKIAITVNSKTVISATDFTVDFLPSITSFTPAKGVEGATVIITGANFSTTASANVVTFNGTAATVTAATATQITTTVPTGATTGKIAITVNSKTVISATDFTVDFPPSITSFTPTSGGVGATVTITGTNFSTVMSENIVKFNNTAATVTGATATQLTTTVPSGASTGKITVQVGTQTATSTDDFEILMVITMAGSGTAGFADGTGTAAQFNYPYGVAVDASGNIYVADTNNNRIRKITSAGVVSTLAGSGTAGFADGTGSAAMFWEPIGAAVDAAGNVYVYDYGNNRIRKITSSGEVSTLAGSTAGFADGTGTAAKFNHPNGVAVDVAGNIYVGDSYNHRIRKITSGDVVSTLAGSGTKGFADGTDGTVQFNYPDGVAVDAAGNVYVADSFNHRIRKITSDGVVSTLAGSTVGSADGTGTAAKFNYPHGVAVDASGNIYIADTNNNLIRKIISSGVVTTQAGIGVNGPSGVVIDASGNIYVADRGNHRIRKITIQ